VTSEGPIRILAGDELLDLGRVLPAGQPRKGDRFA
jgi:hypothetical protein